MLKSHFDAVEEYLLALKKIGDNTGHSLHKGTPRESFIREFLNGHLSEKVSIGTGEIIDKNSRPGEKRNQQDIVIFKAEYPRIDFGGGIQGFLAESVIAIIEVKSKLTEDELLSAIKAARKIKKLEMSQVSIISSGWIPPAPLNFVVAYDGPAKMETVHGWIDKIYKAENIETSPIGKKSTERQEKASSLVDGIFILGKGFIQFDNFPLSFITDEKRNGEDNIDKKWVIVDVERGALLMLFSLLTQAVAGMNFATLNVNKYLSSFEIEPLNLNFK
jgi:hypothetical protein